MSRTFAWILKAATAAVLATTAALPAGAQDESAEGHSHARSELHGGVVTMTREFHFEVAFLPAAVRVYLYDGFQKPLSAKGIEGDVKVYFRKGRKPVEAGFTYVKPAAAGGQDYLEAPLELARVEEGQAKATVNLRGLPGEEEKTVRFRESVQVAWVIEYVCPMACVPPAAGLGSCARCNMDLKPARFRYACPSHPTVIARSEGACWTCGGDLARAEGAAIELPAEAPEAAASRTEHEAVEYVCPMACVSPAAAPGSCPKCNMRLKQVRYEYGCPQHPKVRAQESGQSCWKCNAPLVKQGS